MKKFENIKAIRESLKNRGLRYDPWGNPDKTQNGKFMIWGQIHR